MRRLILFLPLLIAIIWAGWWLFGRSTETEVLAAQQKLITALEDRKWSKVKDVLSDNYSDEFGYNKEAAADLLQQALGNFLFLTLNNEVTSISTSADAAQVQTKIQMDGHGLGFSSMVIGQVNSMSGPWHFHWRKENPWPWGWKLVKVYHSELHIPAMP